MRRRTGVPFLAILVASLIAPASAFAKHGGNPDATFVPDVATCRPTSDADSLDILSNYYPGYWWDHTDLTVVAKVHPSATPEQRAAMADAIATWDSVLRDLPPSLGAEPYPPYYVGWVTLHELGHALGLGHATNLEESTDLMGYGWTQEIEPTLSQCDVEGIAHVFAWAFEAADPYQPGPGPFDCS